MPFPYPKIIDLLVPRLCLVTQIMRLCLQFVSREAEPLDIGSQAEPGNQLRNAYLQMIKYLAI